MLKMVITKVVIRYFAQAVHSLSSWADATFSFATANVGYLSSGSSWLQPHLPHSISRYETGASVPSIKTLVRIARVLEKSTGHFLDE